MAKVVIENYLTFSFSDVQARAPVTCQYDYALHTSRSTLLRDDDQCLEISILVISEMQNLRDCID